MGRRVWGHGLAAAITVGCVICSLTACAKNDGIEPKAEGYDLNVHYSVELERARQKMKDTGNDVGLSILADGVITDAELTELRDRIMQCMVDFGYDRDSMQFDETGAGSAHPPSGASQEESANWGASFNQDLQSCEAKDGAQDIQGLANAAKLNPDNKDARVAAVECLVEQGLVDKSYTLDDYDRDSRNATGPFDESKQGDADFQAKLAVCQ